MKIAMIVMQRGNGNNNLGSKLFLARIRAYFRNA